MTSRATARFWECYRQLPVEIQELARKNYHLWLVDSRYPSLHFKPLNKGQWSIRIGIHYRATGRFSSDDEFTWDWIGTHAEYDRLA